MTRLNQNQLRETLTIPNGEAVSDGLYIASVGPRGLAVRVPVEWTAADLTVEVAEGTDADVEPETWYPILDKDGNLLKITGILTNAAGVYVFPADGWFIGTYSWLRLRSIDTTDESDEDQGAARDLVVSLLG